MKQALLLFYTVTAGGSQTAQAKDRSFQYQDRNGSLWRQATPREYLYGYDINRVPGLPV